MQQVTIQSFGPINYVKMQITDIVVLNGEQGSGKSTIAKVIYLFKSIPEVFFRFLISGELKSHEIDKDLVVVFRKQLIAIFGTTKHFDNFCLKYSYSPNKYIEVTKDKRTGHAYITYSTELKDKLKKIVEKYENHLESMLKHQTNRDFGIFNANRLHLQDSIKKDFQIIFEENRESLFIPAGRSLVSTLSGELRNVDSYNFDFLMKEFVQRVFYQRDSFTKALDEIVEDRKRLTSAPIDFKKVKLAKTLINSILKGEYSYEKGEEKIIIDEDNYVKIKFSSSGQQESLWILNFLFIYILEKKRAFIVFEEPEAHLYPKTQYELMKFISLYLSVEGSQSIITTHSPYIMSAINNLLLSYKTGMKDKQKSQRVIDESFWLNSSSFSAFFVADGKIEDIYDKSANLIDLQYIDSASEVINSDFDALLEIAER